MPTISCTRKPDPSKAEYAGYHEFCHPEHTGGNPAGSFEVFFREPGRGDNLTRDEWNLERGWYWWACFPGCLPDGEPQGPHRTSYLAYVDAKGEAS